jgi:hypothetical protein
MRLWWPGEEFSIRQQITKRDVAAASSTLSVTPSSGPLPQPARQPEKKLAPASPLAGDPLVEDWGEVIQPGWQKQPTDKQVAVPHTIPPRRPNIVPLQ